MKNNKNLHGNKQLPNILTLVRLLMAVLFFILMIAFSAVFRHHGWSKEALAIHFMNLIIFIAAMITDFFDGYYARKLNAVSDFGKIFDPIADKIITVSMMIMLCLSGSTYILLVLLFVIRDILVDGCRMYAASKKISVAANIWGKIKTIVITAGLIIAAIAGPFVFRINFNWNLYIFIINIPLIAGAILSYISGTIYCLKYLKGIKLNQVNNQNTIND